jgi:Tfp pilus assembly protein PilF
MAWAADNPAAEASFARLTGDPLPDVYTPAAWLRRAEAAARDDPASAWRYLSAARAARALPASASPARPDLHLPDLDLDEGLPPALISDTLARLDADLRGVPAATAGGPAALDAYWGRAFAALEAWPQAARLLERAARADPTLVDAHAYLGLARERMGADALAEREYQTALRLAPDHDLARHLLARLLIVERRLTDARPLLDAVLAHDPTNVVAHLDLAAWAEAQGFYPQAETELEAAEQQQSARVAAGVAGPDEAALNTPLLLAQFYLGPGGGARACAAALPAAMRAVARRAGAEEYDALGWAQHLCGDDASARASLDRAVARDPTLAAAHYHRGMALLALGDPGARAALEAAQDFDPQGVWDRRALAALVNH